jgi:hypothetical protein
VNSGAAMLARLLATVPFNVGPASAGAPASLHATGGLEQTPVPGLQVPIPWQESLAVQMTELPAAHVPLWHVSFKSHRLPSLHAVPSGSVGLEQTPDVGSQVPATWHWSLAVHTTGFVPTQVPDSHAPLAKQEFPALHDVPLSGVCEHVPLELHVSREHGLFVSHDAAVHVGASTPTSTEASTETSLETSAVASLPPPPPPVSLATSLDTSTETSVDASCPAPVSAATSAKTSLETSADAS